MSLRVIPLEPGTPAPVSFRTYGNGSGYKTFIEAVYDKEPTEQDVLAFSASLGYGNIMNKEGGYILGEVKITRETIRWVASWDAIPD